MTESPHTVKYAEFAGNRGIMKTAGMHRPCTEPHGSLSREVHLIRTSGNSTTWREISIARMDWPRRMRKAQRNAARLLSGAAKLNDCGSGRQNEIFQAGRILGAGGSWSPLSEENGRPVEYTSCAARRPFGADLAPNFFVRSHGKIGYVMLDVSNRHQHNSDKVGM
jgi:hypothetical protein